MLIITMLIIVLFFKQLSITAFDSAFGSGLLRSTTRWHFLLMGLVTMTKIIPFESVGAILIINFLIGPPTIAYLLTNSLKKMLLLTIGIGTAIAVVGGLVAAYFDVSVAGTMAVTTGVIFAFTFAYSRFSRRVNVQAHVIAIVPKPLES